jgi:Tfp pilus assembly protein PilN
VNTVFTINFRREAYQRELARTRRRLFLLGGWLTYFGVLVLVLGLYVLNGAVLAQRVRVAERRVTRAQQTSGDRTGWKLTEREITVVEDARANPARWRDRLARLAAILPNNVALSSIAVNPENLQSPADQNKLVITGEMKVPASDPIRPVSQFVTLLKADSLFSRGYSSIRLASSQSSVGSLTQFVVECR